MSVDPAVRSVRVAVALCDRFDELLKGPDSVAARKQSRALIGVSGNDSELSLRIGEVQQMYPEIWRHLDEARVVFAARGIDVSTYDLIRAAEGQALGANVDSRHARHGVGQYAVEEYVKSANFNRAGLGRARSAVQALVGVTPQIDWAAIARAEADDPAAAAFARATRVKRWTRFGLLGLVIASPFLYLIHLRMADKADRAARVEAYEQSHRPAEVTPISEADQTELATMVTHLRGPLSAARTAWPSAVTPTALAAAVPGTRPCVLPFEAPAPRGADMFIRDGNSDELGAGTFGSYAASEPMRDDQLADMASIVDAVDRRLAAHRADRSDRARLTGIEPYVVFLIIDREVAPAIAPKDTYMPGQVIGRAFVYSVASARIVCAGKVDARNMPAEASPYLDVISSIPAARKQTELGALLHRELEVRIRQELATALRSTEP